MSTTVLLADDHPIYAEGLAALLKREGMLVVAVCGDGRDAIAQLRMLRPHVALLDMHMPHRSGIHVAESVKHERLGVACGLLSSDGGLQLDQDLCARGVQAVIHKAAPLATVLQAIAALSRGETFYHSGQARHPSEQQTFACPLSTRELEVLRLVATGQSNIEIAAALSISPLTVKNQVASILRKLDVEDRTQAVVNGLRAGWI